MALIRTPSPAYFAPVTHKYLDEDGQLQTLEFDAKFKRLKASEARLVFMAPVGERPNDEQVFECYVLDWRTAAVPVDANAEISSQTAKADLNDLCEAYVGLRGSIALSWWQSISADKPAHYAAKN